MPSRGKLLGHDRASRDDLRMETKGTRHSDVDPSRLPMALRVLSRRTTAQHESNIHKAIKTKSPHYSLISTLYHQATKKRPLPSRYNLHGTSVAHHTLLLSRLSTQSLTLYSKPGRSPLKRFNVSTSSALSGLTAAAAGWLPSSSAAHSASLGSANTL